PSVGFAMGCERLIALMKAAGAAAPARPDAYVLHQGDGALEYAFSLADALRGAGHAVVMHAGGGSFKSQMKKADASGAWLALIVGEDEMKSAQVSVKNLRRNEEQVRVARDGLPGNFDALVRKART